MNNATVEIIYTLLKNCEEYKNESNCNKCSKKDSSECKKKSCEWHYISKEKGGRILWGVDYLLGQILRQIDVPDERKHLSVGAIEKWKELGLDKNDIWNYNYQDWVKCNVSITIDEYIGASSNPTPKNLAKTGGFKFRNVFHDEHIVPIHDILKSLLSIEKDQLTHEEVSKYLDKIHICRMLKSEDRKIHPKYNRGYDLDYKKIYENIYKDNDITIVDFK